MPLIQALVQLQCKRLEKWLSSEYRQACITSRLAKLFTQVKLGNNPPKSSLSNIHSLFLCVSSFHLGIIKFQIFISSCNFGFIGVSHLFSTQLLPRKGNCLGRRACKSTVCILLGLLCRTDDPQGTSLLHPQERGSHSDRRRVTPLSASLPLSKWGTVPSWRLSDRMAETAGGCEILLLEWSQGSSKTGTRIRETLSLSLPWFTGV